MENPRTSRVAVEQIFSLGERRWPREQDNKEMSGNSDSWGLVSLLSKLVVLVLWLGGQYITRKMGEMEGIYDKLIKYHSFYCKVAGMGLRSSDSSEYMNEMNKLKFGATQTAQTVLGDDERSIKGSKFKKEQKASSTPQNS